MEEIGITVIGAGVVGLAVASELAGEKEDVYVIEKNRTFGQETSSRNSEVIHAGIYYPPGSLKAQLCVEGNSLTYELCAKYGIGHRRLGKLIVATRQEDVSGLEELLENGRNSGATLEYLSGEQARRLEPEVNAVCAILSPNTGIVDSHALMNVLLQKARDRGAQVVCGSEVVGVEKLASKYRITVQDSYGRSAFLTRVLINSAGLNSDRIAALAGIDTVGAGYKLHCCKGEYFSLSGKPTRRLVYTVPKADHRGLGIHITVDLQGRTRLGPNAYYVDRVDYGIDGSRKDEFYRAAREIVPTVRYDDIEPESAGVRPKLQGPDDGFRDFVISHERDKGLDGLINLVGIESPGLTASLAIARRVKKMVDGMAG